MDTYLKVPILSGFIKKKLKTALGLTEARAIISGAAPLPEPLKNWFKKIGVNIFNGYGMTENCAICTLLPPSVSKPGSVGRPQTQVELKIDDDSGEILMKGPYVMRGYYKSPDKTAETLVNGWLRTGDQGYIDEEGDLFITGRVKDTFKTAKGKFIVPGPIEWSYGTNLDIEQICLLGIGCAQPMALVNISEVGNTKTKEELIKSLDSTRMAINQELPNYQKVAKIIVMKEPWSVENGLLTPTLKVKRNILNQHYGNLLLEWQHENDNVIFEG